MISTTPQIEQTTPSRQRGKHRQRNSIDCLLLCLKIEVRTHRKSTIGYDDQFKKNHNLHFTHLLFYAQYFRKLFFDFFSAHLMKFRIDHICTGLISSDRKESIGMNMLRKISSNKHNEQYVVDIENSTSSSSDDESEAGGSGINDTKVALFV